MKKINVSEFVNAHEWKNEIKISFFEPLQIGLAESDQADHCPMPSLQV